MEQPRGIVAIAAGLIAGSISLVGLVSIASSKLHPELRCCGECPLTQRSVNVNEPSRYAQNRRRMFLVLAVYVGLRSSRNLIENGFPNTAFLESCLPAFTHSYAFASRAKRRVAANLDSPRWWQMLNRQSFARICQLSCWAAYS